MGLSEDLIAAGNKLLLSNYGRSPIVLARGAGSQLWDVEGRRYLDMTAGIAVCVLGHGDAGMAQALFAQAQRLHHASNLYFIEAQIHLAEALARRGFPGRLFFCNSGTEANEAALKLARRYQIVVRGQPERTDIVAIEGSFHGRTHGRAVGHRAAEVPRRTSGRWCRAASSSRSATSRRRARPSTTAPPRSSSSRSRPRAASTCRRPVTCRSCSALCADRGALLIFDEVQTGVGRTGTFFAYEKEGVVPDVITLAKGLAGGVPMGAMAATEEVGKAFEPGTHASTFGGNPLASAAALYLQKAIDDRQLLARCQDLGAHLGSALLRLSERRRPRTRGVRGRGLLQGLVLDGDATPVVVKARAKGLLVSVAGGNVVRFAPALTVTREELDEAVSLLDATLAEN